MHLFAVYMVVCNAIFDVIDFNPECATLMVMAKKIVKIGQQKTKILQFI